VSRGGVSKVEGFKRFRGGEGRKWRYRSGGLGLVGVGGK